MKSKQLYGISLDDVPEYHLHQFLVYKDKVMTANRKKEFQSCKKFYTDFPNRPDRALKWKNEHASNSNIICILATIKTLYPYTGLKPHRACKTAYPLYVWMSHYPMLFEYLDTYNFFIVTHTSPVSIEISENPFTEARKMVKKSNYYTPDLQNAVRILGLKLIALGYNPSFITTVLTKEGEVLFTAVLKKETFWLNEENFENKNKKFAERSQIEIQRQQEITQPQKIEVARPPLPSISYLMLSCNRLKSQINCYF